jgi:queuosine precursor transporter
MTPLPLREREGPAREASGRVRGAERRAASVATPPSPRSALRAESPSPVKGEGLGAPHQTLYQPAMLEPRPATVFPLSLFVYSVFYGGMVTLAGVLGVKQVALGPLAVEAGIFAFLVLVILSSVVAELHGKAAADRLVRIGLLLLVFSALLIRLVIELPVDEGMYPPAIEAFPIVLGQGARMMIAGLIAYGTSQTLNVLIFSKMASGEGRLLWLRSAVAATISQIVDTVLFISISFLGEREIGSLIVGQMITKVILSIVLVPPLIYLLVALGRRLDVKAA